MKVYKCEYGQASDSDLQQLGNFNGCALNRIIRATTRTKKQPCML